MTCSLGKFQYYCTFDLLLLDVKAGAINVFEQFVWVAVVRRILFRDQKATLLYKPLNSRSKFLC